MILYDLEEGCYWHIKENLTKEDWKLIQRKNKRKYPLLPNGDWKRWNSAENAQVDNSFLSWLVENRFIVCISESLFKVIDTDETSSNWEFVNFLLNK